MPRSGAAMTSNGQGKPELWLFGGEFSSPKQGIFYHYADFWKLDCSTREWTKIEAKGAPSGKPLHPDYLSTYIPHEICVYVYSYVDMYSYHRT